MQISRQRNRPDNLMRQPNKRRTARSNRSGAILPLIAVSTVILFVAAVLAIDIARIHVTRSELRTATDAAARAAVEALGREQSQQAAIDAAMTIAQSNTVAGKGLTLDPDNIRFGVSLQNTDGSFTFMEGGTVLNAVSVIGERTATSPDGPVGMMFGKMFGQESFSPVQTATATRLDRDVSLVLDVSGSMADFGRFEALKNALDVFLSELQETTQQERVSLTVYSTTPRKTVELTQNLISISDAFDDESPGGRTGIGLALRVGLDSLQNDSQSRPFALKSIVVMTDGNHNEGISPSVVATECDDANVTVHAITFSEGADKVLMQGVAETTGGTHLHADSDEQLLQAFQTIAKQLQVMLIQ